jgi:predicted nucleotidyltransferase
MTISNPIKFDSEIDFALYAQTVNEWTDLVSSQGTMMTNGSPFSHNVFSVMFGIARQKHQQYMKGVDSRAGGVINPSVKKVIYFLQMLPESQFVQETKLHIPLFEQLARQEYLANTDRQRETAALLKEAKMLVEKNPKKLKPDALANALGIKPARAKTIISKLNEGSKKAGV